MGKKQSSFFSFQAISFSPNEYPYNRCDRSFPVPQFGPNLTYEKSREKLLGSSFGFLGTVKHGKFGEFPLNSYSIFTFPNAKFFSLCSIFEVYRYFTEIHTLRWNITQTLL